MKKNKSDPIESKQNPERKKQAFTFYIPELGMNFSAARNSRGGGGGAGGGAGAGGAGGGSGGIGR